MKKFTKSAIKTDFCHVTGPSFAVPVTSQENVAAKFQPDRPSGLAGEVEKGDGWMDGWTVRDENTLSAI